MPECVTCHVDKPLAEFGITKKGNSTYSCKDCTKEKQRQQSARRRKRKGVSARGALPKKRSKPKGRGGHVYKPPNPAPLVVRYERYLKGASKRGLVFELALGEFQVLTSSPCAYCDSPPDPHNGVDRQDNRQGYTKDNSVPCCWPCNRMKGDLDYGVFLRQIQRIYTYSM